LKLTKWDVTIASVALGQLVVGLLLALIYQAQPAFVAFWVLLFGLLLAFSHRIGCDYMAIHRPAALNAFSELSIHSSEPRFQFDGKTAQIIEDEEGIERARNGFIAYTLTRIARNEAGEYFWFYFRSDSAGGKPQFKHIEQASAKALLKKKYLAPSPAPIEIAPTI